MKQFFILFIVLFTASHISHAQVPKKVVVEHFTNTRCGNCSSRNPGFFANLNNQTNTLHLAIHPSAPYSSCILNKHNKSGNDNRTNHYGIYGGTPRLVIQGSVISGGQNYGSSTIFDPHTGQTSPIKISIRQTKFGTDSIQSTVVIEVVDTHSYTGDIHLFAALAEDTVFYNAPNGEDEHFHVFRKGLTSEFGTDITLPTNVGDSLVLNYSSENNSDWDFDRIYTVAIVQDGSTDEVIQAEEIAPSASQSSQPTGIEPAVFANNLRVYPNPANEQVFIHLNDNISANAALLDITGKKVLSKSFDSNTTLDISALNSGLYILRISNAKGEVVKKVYKQ